MPSLEVVPTSSLCSLLLGILGFWRPQELDVAQQDSWADDTTFLSMLMTRTAPLRGQQGGSSLPRVVNMAGSDEGMPCQRNAKCKCPDCLASSASFSLSELKAITSTINYGKRKRPCVSVDVPQGRGRA